MKFSDAIRMSFAKHRADGKAGKEIDIDLYNCEVCKEMDRRHAFDCNQGCPLFQTMGTSCTVMAHQAHGGSYRSYRDHNPRWREDIFEIAYACELAGD